MSSFDNQVLVIKPDFINEKGFELVKYHLDRQGLNVASCYLIADYRKYSNDFREQEVPREIADVAKQKTKFEDISVSADAYEILYDNVAILVLIKNNQNLSAQEFFSKLRAVKTSIRSKYTKERPFGIFLKKTDNKKTLYKMVAPEILPQMGELKLAHINGIHFCHFDNFLSGFDYNFALDYGIISKENEIHIDMLEEKAPVQAQEPKIDFDYFLKNHVMESFDKELIK